MVLECKQKEIQKQKAAGREQRYSLKRAYQLTSSTQQGLCVTGTLTVLGLIVIRIRILTLAFLECGPRADNIPQRAFESAMVRNYDAFLSRSTSAASSSLLIISARLLQFFSSSVAYAALCTPSNGFR